MIFSPIVPSALPLARHAIGSSKQLNALEVIRPGWDPLAVRHRACAHIYWDGCSVSACSKMRQGAAAIIPLVRGDTDGVSTTRLSQQQRSVHAITSADRKMFSQHVFWKEKGSDHVTVATDPSDLKYVRRHWWILRPNGHFRKTWDAVQGVILIYVALVVPFRVGRAFLPRPETESSGERFPHNRRELQRGLGCAHYMRCRPDFRAPLRLDVQVTGGAHIFDTCIDAYWWLDLLLNFITGAAPMFVVAPPSCHAARLTLRPSLPARLPPPPAFETNKSIGDEMVTRIVFDPKIIATHYLRARDSAQIRLRRARAPSGRRLRSLPGSTRPCILIPRACAADVVRVRRGRVHPRGHDPEGVPGQPGLLLPPERLREGRPH